MLSCGGGGGGVAAWIGGKGCKKGRTPVDLVQTGNESGVSPSRAPLPNVEVVPVPHVVLDASVSRVTNAERVEINDCLFGAIHVGIRMIVVIIDRDRCQRVKGFFVCVKEIEGCFVGICKYTGSTRGRRLDTVEELDEWRIIKVEQVCVES